MAFPFSGVDFPHRDGLLSGDGPLMPKCDAQTMRKTARRFAGEQIEPIIGNFRVLSGSAQPMARKLV